MRPCSSKSPWPRLIVWAWCVVSLAGCVTDAETVRSPQDTSQKVLLVGRVVVVFTGEKSTEIRSGGARNRVNQTADRSAT